MTYRFYIDHEQIEAVEESQIRDALTLAWDAYTVGTHATDGCRKGVQLRPM